MELETPNSRVTLKKRNQFDSYARKGVEQVKDWRRWIGTNLHQARDLNPDTGHRLPDIGPDAEGVVLVGRRETLRPSAKVTRRELHESERIRMQTYDRLVEQLEGARRFSGPWIANAYLL